MSYQGAEYYTLIEKLKEYIYDMIEQIKPNTITEAVNVVNEYIFDKMESTKKLHIFFFKIQEITKLSDWNYGVTYTLHEHASTSLSNIAQIGILMSLQRANSINQTKVEDGYLFSTNPLEDVINIYEEIEQDIPLVKEVELDIDVYTDIENNTKINNSKDKYIDKAKKMLNRYKV